MTPRNHKNPTYRCWAHMLSRCNNPKAHSYRWYGGKGIRVCDRWRDFGNFIADMGEKPQGLTLDRTDSAKDYSPDNCRWTTWGVQARSSRRMRMWNGKPTMMKEIAAELGITHQCLNKRVMRGTIILEGIEP